MEAVYVNAGNDAAGNPRRGWIIVQRGTWVGFVDEGYEGWQALRAAVPASVADSAWGVRQLIITPGAYRDLRRMPGPHVNGSRLTTRPRARTV